MTDEEFFVQLAKTHRTWHLSDGGELRSCCGCPLTAVAKKLSGIEFSVRFPSVAIAFLDLACDFGEVIVEAADNRRGHRADIRDRLLAACGVG